MLGDKKASKFKEESKLVNFQQWLITTIASTTTLAVDMHTCTDIQEKNGTEIMEKCTREIPVLKKERCH